MSRLTKFLGKLATSASFDELKERLGPELTEFVPLLEAMARDDWQAAASEFRGYADVQEVFQRVYAAADKTAAGIIAMVPEAYRPEMQTRLAELEAKLRELVESSVPDLMEGLDRAIPEESILAFLRALSIGAA